MKKVVVKDEMWPVFYLENEDYPYCSEMKIDIPEDKLEWIKQVNIEHSETQEYIRNLMDEHSN